MRLTAVWTNNLVALLVGIGMYAMFAFLPEFVQTPSSAGYGFGASITQSGLILLPSSVTMFAVGMFAGRLAARVGGKALIVAGCLIGVVSMGIIAFAHAQKWELYLATAILGIGFGLAFAAMSALIVSAVPPEQTGVASGMNANIRTIGGSIGAALMASIVTSNLEPGGLPEESGYTAGFAMLGAGLILAAAGRAADPGHRPGRPRRRRRGRRAGPPRARHRRGRHGRRRRERIRPERTRARTGSRRAAFPGRTVATLGRISAQASRHGRTDGP